MLFRSWAGRRLVLVTSVLVMLFGCRKPEEDLGLDLLPGDPLGVRVETTLLHAYTIVPKPIRTSGLTRNLLGSYLDPQFGKVQAGIVAQLRLSSNNVGVGQDNSGLVADSIVVALAFDGINYAYGNLNAQVFRAFELSASLSVDSTYESNEVPEHIPVDLVVNRGGVVTPEPFKKPFVGGDSLQPQVRLRLDNALGQRILDAFGTPDLADNTAFLEFFKGIYITVDNGAQVPFQQGMLYFNMLNTTTKTTIYYRNTLETDPEPQVFDLPMNQSSVRYTVVSLDRDQALEPGFAAALSDTVSPVAHTYVQALGGARTVVQFPELRDLATEGLALARAELVVPVPGTFNPYLPPPSQLFIFRRDPDTGADAFLPDQNAGAGSIDGNYRKDAKEYRFNITRYVQGILDGSIPDTGVELVSGSNGVTANRVILAGPAHTEAPMRLDLIFTTY